MPKGQHNSNRSQKTGLARISGAGASKKPTPPHVPQRVIQKSGRVTRTQPKKK